MKKIDIIAEGVYPNTIAENAIVADKYKNIANLMKNFFIEEFISNISKIYRESGNCKQILDYIYN